MKASGVSESVVQEAVLAWLQSAGWVIRHGAETAPGGVLAEWAHSGQVNLAQRLRDAGCFLMVRS